MKTLFPKLAAASVLALTIFALPAQAAGDKGELLGNADRTVTHLKHDPAFATASRMLADEGYLAAAIRPPSVPAGTARLRLTFTAQHPDDAIARLADIVRDKILKH